MGKKCYNCMLATGDETEWLKPSRKVRCGFPDCNRMATMKINIMAHWPGKPSYTLRCPDHDCVQRDPKRIAAITGTMEKISAEEGV